MSGLNSVGMPFFSSVKFFLRGDFLYFVNPQFGTWVALPNYYAKNFFNKQSDEIPEEKYQKIYESLAKNNIIRDVRLNLQSYPLEIKPLLVKFQSTGKCNLKCAYCFNSANIRNKSMNLEIMRRAVDYCFESPFARKQAPIFLIYGGEPMIERKSLFETINYIRNKAQDNYVGIITNATLLTEEDIIFFKANNVNITISFDGLPEFQAKNRHRKTDLSDVNKVLSKFDLLNKHNYMPKSNVLCVVTREMSSRLLECVIFLQNYGAMSMEFLTMNLLGDAKDKQAYSTNIPEFIKSMKNIVEAIETGQINRLRRASLRSRA